MLSSTLYPNRISSRTKLYICLMRWYASVFFHWRSFISFCMLAAEKSNMGVSLKYRSTDFHDLSKFRFLVWTKRLYHSFMKSLLREKRQSIPISAEKLPHKDWRPFLFLERKHRFLYAPLCFIDSMNGFFLFCSFYWEILTIFRKKNKIKGK